MHNSTTIPAIILIVEGLLLLCPSLSCFWSHISFRFYSTSTFMYKLFKNQKSCGGKMYVYGESYALRCI